MSLDQMNEHLKTNLPNTFKAPTSGLLLISSDGSEKDFPSIHKKFSPIAYIADNKHFKIKLKLNEKQINHVKVGQDAQIRVAALNKTFKGVVHQVIEFPEVKKIPEYHIVVNLLDDPEQDALSLLKIGMGTVVSIVTHHEQAIMVPIDALTTLDGEHFIETITDGKSNLTAVELGETEGMNIRITSGLNIGDEIVVNHTT